jgi:hypothetical protein
MVLVTQAALEAAEASAIAEMSVTVVGLATAEVFQIAPEAENVFRTAPEMVIVVVPRIARLREQVIVPRAEQTEAADLGPLEQEEEIASAIAAFQAVPEQEAEVASVEVPEATAVARHAPAAVEVPPAWVHPVVVGLEAAEVVAAAAAGGSSS